MSPPSSEAPGRRRAIVPVLMSGGSGARLWPLSTPAAPKPFHALAGRNTLIQETALRFAPDAQTPFAAPIVVCHHRHWALARAQLREVGVTPSAVILEPVGRNTAAVAVIAAWAAEELHPGAQVILAPTDHAIADPLAFRAAVARGAPLEDRIVTFGVQPTAPETGFGYIQYGASLAEGVFDVVRFVEKPPRDEAERFLRQGGYCWNAGIFLFDPAVMLGEMAKYRPDILAATNAALAAGERLADGFALPEAVFGQIPAASVDTAVMERTDRAAVASLDAGWADLGTWSEVWRRNAGDADGNVLRGEALAPGSSGSLVWAADRPVIALGLQDMIVVETAEGVFVAPRSRSHEIRQAVEALRQRRAPDEAKR